MSNRNHPYLGSHYEKPFDRTGEFVFGHPFGRVLFFGRSNVGKSSLLNALLGQRCARSSKQPGKTTALHYFLGKGKQGKYIFVDVPGYGFAKRSRSERGTWEVQLLEHLDQDTRMRAILLLVDAKVGITSKDEEAFRFAEGLEGEKILVLTKIDRLKRQSDRAKLERKLKDLRSLTEFSIASVSATTGAGIDGLWRLIEGEKSLTH